ncbi:MAG: MFS transporter [Thermoprotei archaeon]
MSTKAFFHVDFRPLLIFALSFLIDLGLSSINFGVPLYAYKLGAPQYLIGLIASAFGLSYIFSAVYSVKIAFGRNLANTITILLLSYTGIAAIYIIVRNPFLFIVIRAFEGFILGNLYPLTDTLPAASGSGKNLVPWYNAGWAFSYIVAPLVLGYLITLLGFSSPFTFAALATLSALVLIRMSAGRLRLNTMQNTSKRVLSLGRNTLSEIAFPAFIAGFITAVFSSLYPAYLASRRFDYESIGLVMGTMAASRTIVLAASGRIQAAIGLGKLKAIGYALSVLIAIPTVLHGLTEQFICALSVGAGVGLLYHVGLSNSLSKAGEYQTSELEASLGTGFFSGPLLGAAISDISPNYVYMGVSIIPLIPLISLKRNTNTKPNQVS